MRKLFNKIMLCCIVAGLGLMLTGHVWGGKKSLYISRYGVYTENHLRARNGEGEVLVVNEKALSAFETVNVSLVDAQVEFIPADFYGIELLYADWREITWEVNRAVLTVQDEARVHRIGFNLDFDFMFEETTDNNVYLSIYAPADALADIMVKITGGTITCKDFSAEQVMLETVSGAIYAAALRVEDDLQCKTVSGEMILSNIRADAVTAETTSGKINMTAMRTDTLSAKTVSGKMMLSDIRTDTITAKSTSGAIELADARATQLSIAGTSGKVSVEGQFEGAHVKTVSGGMVLRGKFGGLNEWTSVSGHIDFYTSYRESDYFITHKAVSGGLYIDDKRIAETDGGRGKSASSNTIKISTVSGDAYLYFE